ncbi:MULTISPECIES: hypothetical protein [unclassified Cryobacterium]|uniref:hypothetical protein n=1 Tax=unclassified Cryobacterium TaxID=2649013 RepID=UPI00106D3BB8|nr:MULTISPECIES: hypothetical protein [unclassified Cryobacterium]TFB96280.1 hypothetical protein E3O39_09240 [Cryobacterium sp. MDB2-A-1]TFC12565.1 hypothetical protein E3O35_06405 [Cryobacterium sp. MDB2-A-2]
MTADIVVVLADRFGVKKIGQTSIDEISRPVRSSTAVVAVITIGENGSVLVPGELWSNIGRLNWPSNLGGRTGRETSDVLGAIYQLIHSCGIPAPEIALVAQVIWPAFPGLLKELHDVPNLTMSQAVPKPVAPKPVARQVVVKAGVPGKPPVSKAPPTTLTSRFWLAWGGVMALIVVGLVVFNLSGAGKSTAANDAWLAYLEVLKPLQAGVCTTILFRPTEEEQSLLITEPVLVVPCENPAATHVIASRAATDAGVTCNSGETLIRVGTDELCRANVFHVGQCRRVASMERAEADLSPDPVPCDIAATAQYPAVVTIGAVLGNLTDPCPDAAQWGYRIEERGTTICTSPPRLAEPKI